MEDVNCANSQAEEVASDQLVFFITDDLTDPICQWEVRKSSPLTYLK